MITCVFISPTEETIASFLHQCQDKQVIERYIIFDGSPKLKLKYPKMDMIYENQKYIKENIFTKYSIIIKGYMLFFKTFFIKDKKSYYSFSNNFPKKIYNHPKCFDFVEIGTSNFSTCIQDVMKYDYAKGISIEPIKEYIDDLPNHPGVIKVCNAVSNKCSRATIYAIPKETIENYFPDKLWLRGCNTLYDYHPLHKKHKLEKWVNISEVEVTSVEKLWKDYNIKSVDFLQVDCEGHDTVILNALYEMLEKDETIPRPKKIKFETNEWSSPKDVLYTIDMFIGLGYKLKYHKKDTMLIYPTPDPLYELTPCFVETENIGKQPDIIQGDFICKNIVPNNHKWWDYTIVVNNNVDNLTMNNCKIFSNSDPYISYIQYIIDNYDNLSNNLLFIEGKIYSQFHDGPIFDRVYHDNVNKKDMTNLCIFTENSDDATWIHDCRKYKNIYEKLIGKSINNNIKSIWGHQYNFTKDDIIKKSLQEYELLLKRYLDIYKQLELENPNVPIDDDNWDIILENSNINKMPKNIMEYMFEYYIKNID